MNILITGGLGFIGSHSIRILKNRGLQNILVLDDLSSNILSPQAAGVACYKQDIRDRAGLEIFFRDFRPTHILHLAAQPSLKISQEKPVFDLSVNAGGILNLIHLAQIYGVKRFVMASTSAVYRNKAMGLYFPEDELDPISPYGISKMAAECYLRRSGLSFAILRYGNVYGPGQIPIGENQLIPRFLSHVYQMKPFSVLGNGSQRRDFVYVDDIARLNEKALISPMIGAYNAGWGESHSVIEVLDYLRALSRFESGIPSVEGVDPRQDVRLNSSITKSLCDWKPEVHLSDGLRRTWLAWPRNR